VGLAAVRDLREVRRLETPEEVEAFEQDVLAGFVLARASAGMADATIKQETGAVIELRQWFGRLLWEVQPKDLDRYFGVYHRGRPPATLANKAQSISVFWQYLELRHKVEIYNLTGRVVESPLDEMNRPRARAALNLRVPPSAAEIKQLFDGWRDELRATRKFAVAARNYTSARLIGQVGLRINEARTLDLDDIKWDLGPLGKLHVRFGKGHGGRGPKQRMVPLINAIHRDTLLVALRSLFGLLKGRRLIFTNPTTQIRVHRVADTPAPLDSHAIDQAVRAAQTPPARLVLAVPSGGRWSSAATDETHVARRDRALQLAQDMTLSASARTIFNQAAATIQTVMDEDARQWRDGED